MSGRHPRTLLDADADIISKLYNGLRGFKFINKDCSAIASAQMTLQVLNESRSILDYIKFHLRVCVCLHSLYVRTECSTARFRYSGQYLLTPCRKQGVLITQNTVHAFFGHPCGLSGAIRSHALHNACCVKRSGTVQGPSPQCSVSLSCSVSTRFFFFWKFSEIRCMTLENRREPKKKRAA